MTEHLDDATADLGQTPGRRWRRRALLVLIPALAASVVFACGLLAGRGLGGSPDRGAASAPQVPTETVTVTAVPTPKPSPPTRLIVSSLGIDAPVVDIDLGTDAVLEPPTDPDLVGYWTGSAKIGATKGRTVITGHTVQDGDGALDELPDIKPGATVQVASYSGLHRYRVTDNLYATYAEVAKRARDVFGQQEEAPGGARLILITCTEFNGRFYEGNSIIVAEPINEPPTETPSASATPSATANPSETPSQEPTTQEPAEPAPSESTSTPSTPTRTPRPTPSPTRTPTPTPSPTRTPTPSSSPTPSPSPSPSEQPTAGASLAPGPDPGRSSSRSRAKDDVG